MSAPLSETPATFVVQRSDSPVLDVAPRSRKPALFSSTRLRIAAAAVLVLGAVGLGLLVSSLKNLDVDPDMALASMGGAPRTLSHKWQLYRGHHWQIAGDAIETREATDASEGTRGTCGTGMVEVKGNMKVDPSANAFYDKKSIEELQKTTCSRWINKDFPERCAEFDRDKWLELSRDLKTKPMHFCVDRFEYPNQKGVFPIIMVNFNESEALCAEQGKRLCDEAEWTYACEGDEATPYPNGYKRDATACVIDHQWKPYNGAAFNPREAEAAGNEMDRLWQGKASGTQPRCKSASGVYDLTGNVDEWTHTIREGERPSILKGGYWGPVRTRCRPATRSHDENHTFYQQGFRCCSDASSKVRRVDAEPQSIAPLPQEQK